MSEEVESIPWFALHIRMHNQEYVETALEHKGYPVFAPSYLTTRIVARRERQIRAALFPGYIFCSLNPLERLPVLTIPGVIGILGTGNCLTQIPTSEIDAIRQTVDSGLPVEPFRLLQPGEPVQVLRGPLAGIKGVVVQHKGKHRLVINVTALNDRAVAVEVDQEIVARLEAPGFAQAGQLVARPAVYYKQAS